MNHSDIWVLNQSPSEREFFFFFFSLKISDDRPYIVPWFRLNQSTESEFHNIIWNSDNSPSSRGFEVQLPFFSACDACCREDHATVESQARGAGADKEARLLSGHSLIKDNARRRHFLIYSRRSLRRAATTETPFYRHLYFMFIYFCHRSRQKSFLV